MTILPFICFASDWMILDLDLIESPAKMSQGGGDEFISGVLRTKLFLEKYNRLPRSQQHRLLLQWFAKIEPKLDRLCRENSLKGEQSELEPRYITEEMSQADISKIDIIFLSQGRGTIFHTEEWVRAVYGIPQTGEFRLPSKPFWPTMLSTFRSGPGFSEPDCSAFDTFMNQERGFALRWFRSNLDDRQLSGMTHDRMQYKVLGFVDARS